MTPRATERNARARTGRKKMISQIPPKQPEGPTPALRGEPVLRASDLARCLEPGSGASETRTRDPLLAKQVLFQLSYSPGATRSLGYPPRGRGIRRARLGWHQRGPARPAARKALPGKRPAPCRPTPGRRSTRRTRAGRARPGRPAALDGRPGLGQQGGQVVDPGDEVGGP